VATGLRSQRTRPGQVSRLGLTFLVHRAKGCGMGFLRKATWVSTGGASGLVFKANSKKERIANALEAQNRATNQANRSARPTLADSGIYHFSNYDGGFPLHSSPEKRGTLKFVDAQWQLHFAKGEPFVHGGVGRYPMQITTATQWGGRYSCWVTMTDKEDPTISAKFRIEGMSADQFTTSMARHQPKPAPPVRGLPRHVVGASPIGIADEIAKLGQLRDKGLLTEAEFDAQKARLLRSPQTR